MGKALRRDTTELDVKDPPSIMNPGQYNIAAGGKVEVKNTGEIIFTKLKLIPAIQTKSERPQNLKAIWNNSSELTYEHFRSELVRIGYLSKSNNRLSLTGKEIRSLHHFLEKYKVITQGLDMVTIYHAFAGSFQLQFKGASSLQRLKDFENLDLWKRTFSLRCVSNSNATQYIQEENERTEI